MPNRGGEQAPMSKTQAALEANKALQTMLHTRQMIQEALRQATAITESAKPGGGGKRVSGTICFAWGAGAQGQLGQPGTQLRSLSAPSKVRFDDGLEDTVVSTSCGAGHVASITDAGEVWAWGYGRDGQLGYKMTRSTNEPQPTKVDTLAKGAYWADRSDGGSKTVLPIREVACGLQHTIALDVEGTVHSWGAGKNGQLGHRKCAPNSPYPRIVTYRFKFTQIACGDMHNAAIDERGRIFTWGSGEAGQLGQGSEPKKLGPSNVPWDPTRPCPEPTQIDSLMASHYGKMKQVACGAQFTAAVSSSGELYVWGFGEHLYSKEVTSNFAFEPTQIKLRETVADVACGRAHMLARTDIGDVYCWGEGKDGQLGHGRTAPCNAPRIVLENKKIVQVACGRYHSVALNAYGVLYTWGCGESGQLGHGVYEKALLLPKVCEPLLTRIVGQVSCGEHHTTAVCSAMEQDIDEQMRLWLQNEQEEFELKQDAADTCPYGLGKKELAALQTERDALRLARALRTEKEDFKMKNEIYKELEEISDMEEIKKHIQEQTQLRGVRSPLNMSTGDPVRPGSSGSAIGSEMSFMSGDSFPAVDSSRSHTKSKTKTRAKSKGRTRTRQRGSRSESVFPELSGTSAVSPFGDGVVPYDEGTMEGGAPGDEDDDRFQIAADMTRDHSFYETMVSHTRKQSKGMEEQDRRGSSVVRDVTTLRTSFQKDRVELMKQVQASISVGDMDMDQWEIEKAWNTMRCLKEDYDATKNLAERKVEQCMKMITEIHALEESGENFEKYVTEMKTRITFLQQEFKTVKLKWKEALENRKNYDDIFSQLKFEAQTQRTELNVVKELCADQAKQLVKVTKLRDNAQKQKKAAVREQIAFSRDFDKRSEIFMEYRAHFKGLGLTMQLAQERTEAYTKDRQKKNERFNRKEAAKLSRENRRMEEAMLEQEQKRLEADFQKAELEKKYKKLISATNLTSPNDIIDKYYSMEQNHEDLRAQGTRIEKKRDELEAEKDQLMEEQIKAMSIKGMRRFQDVDRRRVEYRTLSNKLKDQGERLNQKRQDQAGISQGIHALATRMCPLLISREAITEPSHSADGVVKVLDLLESVLTNAISEISSGATLGNRVQEDGQVTPAADIIELEPAPPGIAVQAN